MRPKSPMRCSSASPKSISFGWPSLVRPMLLGSTSRCSTPDACRRSRTPEENDPEIDRLLPRHRTATHPVTQRAPGEVLDDQHQGPAPLLGSVDEREVRMHDVRHRSRLAVQPPGRLGPERRECLDRHLTIEDRVERQIDDPGAANTDQMFETKLALDEQRQRGGSRRGPARSIAGSGNSRPAGTSDTARAGSSCQSSPPGAGVVVRTRLAVLGITQPAVLDLHRGLSADYR